FQAEDGIRDRTVTGVQTCALPISRRVDYPAAFGSRRAGVFARRPPCRTGTLRSAPLIETQPCDHASYWRRPRRGFCGDWQIYREWDVAHHREIGRAHV